MTNCQVQKEQMILDSESVTLTFKNHAFDRLTIALLYKLFFEFTQPEMIYRVRGLQSLIVPRFNQLECETANPTYPNEFLSILIPGPDRLKS